MNARCDTCNKFMSYNEMNDSISYVPYGNSNDLEPPDERYIHGECWEKMSDREKQLTRNASWCKPNEPGSVDLI